MDKDDNVFIKLQIEKSRNAGGLMLTINFDKNSPNFSVDNDMISWSPTFEELDFVIETFGIISKRKNQEDQHPEEIRDDASHFPSDSKTEDSFSESSEKKIAAFEPLKGEFDVIENKPDSLSEKKDDEKKIFVQVDDKTIDEAFKRKSVDVDEALKKKSVDVEEALILDEEDKGIIDRMLKKRGKDKDSI